MVELLRLHKLIVENHFLVRQCEQDRFHSTRRSAWLLLGANDLRKLHMLLVAQHLFVSRCHYPLVLLRCHMRLLEVMCWHAGQPVSGAVQGQEHN